MPSSAEGQSLGEIAASFGISEEEALAIWQTRDIERDLADDVRAENTIAPSEGPEGVM